MFLSFGTLLGAIRPSKRQGFTYHTGFISYDKDADIGWLPLTPQEKDRYFECCMNAGLFNWDRYDRSSRLGLEEELVWFSLKGNGYARACNWFFFKWNDYFWHTKGRLWLSEYKFPSKQYPRKKTAQGMMLGAPSRYFFPLKKIIFEGNDFNIPLKAGSLCDLWYSGWHEPREGGASSKQVTGIINDWDDKNTWEVL